MLEEAEVNHPATPDDALPPMVPDLSDDVISEILHRLPSKEAYRLTAVCRGWRVIVASPAFLCRHLSPRPLLDERPYAVILQPRRKVGYTHLTVVPTNPDDRVDLNFPLDPKYTSKPGESRHVATKPETRDQAAEVAEAVQGGAYVEFFERTVPALNISLVASHGRLLLARSRTHYFVCDPAANRWLALPPCSISPTRETAPGFHYDLDAATGLVSFTVVRLLRSRRGRVRVETFSSTTGRWATTVLAAKSVASRLDVASPGIHAGGACFYWLCLRRRGHVIRYDAARGRASLVREPPKTEDSKGRVWLSLGSAGGRLRLCTFDVRDEDSHNALPHEDIEGVHGVWVLEAGDVWRCVHEDVVDDMATWYFHMLHGKELAVDYAGACSDYIIVDKDSYLMRYDLETGDKVDLARLYTDDGKLGGLYDRFQAFPFFI